VLECLLLFKGKRRSIYIQPNGGKVQCKLIVMFFVLVLRSGDVLS
jgi:hypothetical protein